MGYDPFSPISLAQVNVLCIPAGEITVEKFDELLRALGAFSLVSLKNTAGAPDFFAYRDGHVLLRVSSRLDHIASSALELSDFNARPQVLIGLADGELLSALPKREQEHKIAQAISTLKQVSTDLNDTATCSLIVVGGDSRPLSDEFYFVDLDGDGPSLLDATRGIVNQLQDQHADRIKQLSESSSPNSVSHNSVQSSANVTNRPLERARDSPNRTNSPVNEEARDDGANDKNSSANAERTVLLGHLYLQAGQWPEALRNFSQGAALARDSLDHLSYAKALEGLLVCMLLFTWAHLNFNIPQVCYQATDRRSSVYNSPSISPICSANRSTSDALSNGKLLDSAHALTSLIPQLLNTIISLYEKAAGIHQNGLLSKLLCYARVRWANLLLCMKHHGSTLHDAALENLVEGLSASSANSLQASSSVSLILQGKALTKIYVDAALEAQARLPIRDAAPLQIAVTLSLSLLGVERKQAFHLREFLQVLGPSLVEARRAGAAEVGVHPSASFTSWESSDYKPGRPGIQPLLESLCESYGLPEAKPEQVGSEPLPPIDSLRSALHLWSVVHLSGNAMMKIDTLRLCIEVSDAIPDLQSSLNFMSRLLQISIGKPTLHANLANPLPLISESEQSHLLLNIQKTVSTAEHHRITGARARYWDKCLVRHIELCEDLNSDKLMPHTARDLFLVSNTNIEMGKDPFIFNPFAKAKGGSGQAVIVAGEPTRFNVMLQNPLQTEIEIEDIALTVEGCDFQSDHHSIVLGPLCSQVFILSGKALGEGQLVVTGCRATVRGCHSEEYLIVHGDWKPSYEAKQMVRTSILEPANVVTLPIVKQLPLTGISALPRLSLASTSLLRSSLMLLEGESTTVEMIFRNESEVDIDLLLLTFEDSVTRRLEEALGNKDLLPADLYEIQNQIASRPVVKLLDMEDKEGTQLISRGQKARFCLQLFGRPGLTDITVLVDYTRLGKSREEVKGSFYTRQLRYTITTTVNGSIDIPRCSVLPLDGTLSSTLHRDERANIKSLLVPRAEGETGENNNCILLLDVRNIWPQPLEVEIQATHPLVKQVNGTELSDDPFVVTDTLQPGQMTRLLLLAPRILITDPYAPIPSLDTKRQFVVSASKMTIEAEAATRESFWYRESLLKCLKATWKEQSGHRSGQIDMRKGIRLSSRMIDALKLDLVDIVFSLRATESSSDENWQTSTIKRVGNSHYQLTRNKFANLVIKVHNRSARDARLLLRLQPSLRNQPHNVALDLSKRFAWSGVLQRVIHPSLGPNEARELELPVIALAEGEYEINGTVEEVKAQRKMAELPSIEVGGGAERRIWHARRPCLIDVGD